MLTPYKKNQDLKNALTEATHSQNERNFKQSATHCLERQSSVAA